MANAIDIAWAAGLLEGEGCFWLKHGNCPAISMNSTDRDVIVRLMGVFEGGFMTMPTRDPRGHRKQQYRADYARQDRAVEIMREVLPYMGERRAARIKECISIWENKPKRNHKDL